MLPVARAVSPTHSGTRGSLTAEPLWPRQRPKLHQRSQPPNPGSGRGAPWQWGSPGSTRLGWEPVPATPRVCGLPAHPQRSPSACCVCTRGEVGGEAPYRLRQESALTGCEPPGLRGLQVCDRPGLGGDNNSPPCRSDASQSWTARPSVCLWLDLQRSRWELSGMSVTPKLGTLGSVSQPKHLLGSPPPVGFIRPGFRGGTSCS